MHGNKIHCISLIIISKIYALSILLSYWNTHNFLSPVVSCLMMMITQIRDSVRPAATMTMTSSRAHDRQHKDTIISASDSSVRRQRAT